MQRHAFPLTIPHSLSSLVCTATLLGNVLLTSAFVAYAGAFNTQLRGFLVDEVWRPALAEDKPADQQGHGDQRNARTLHHEILQIETGKTNSAESFTYGVLHCDT